ncbi:MAG TPA: hypothetical protein VGM90_38045 [Kofleriaceae bacterium]|jgi:hypothetical protein
MTTFQTISLDQLSTISGGQTAPASTRSRTAPATPVGPPAPSSTGSTVSGAAPRATFDNSIDLTGSADTDGNWTLRGQGEHKVNDNFSVNAYVQGQSRNGRQSTEVGGGLHFRF